MGIPSLNVTMKRAQIVVKIKTYLFNLHSYCARNNLNVEKRIVCTLQFQQV